MSDHLRPRARPEHRDEPPRPHTRPLGLGASPDDVAAAATETAALPPLGTVLIGVFDRPSGPSALLRLADGRVERVEEGDRVDGGVVAAIDEGRLVLARDGTEEVLPLLA